MVSGARSEGKCGVKPDRRVEGRDTWPIRPAKITSRLLVGLCRGENRCFGHLSG
jgi:hypothetical protein